MQMGQWQRRWPTAGSSCSLCAHDQANRAAFLSARLKDSSRGRFCYSCELLFTQPAQPDLGPSQGPALWPQSILICDSGPSCSLQSQRRPCSPPTAPNAKQAGSFSTSGAASRLPSQPSRLSFAQVIACPNTTLIEMAHWGFAGAGTCLQPSQALPVVHLFKYSGPAPPSMRVRTHRFPSF